MWHILVPPVALVFSAARAQQGAAQSACLCRTLKTTDSTSSYGGVVPGVEAIGLDRWLERRH